MNHGSGGYVYRIRSWIYTNTVEGRFSILKRGLAGKFRSESEQHLQRYCHEFDFRWNYRIKTGFDDVQRALVMLQTSWASD